MVMPTIPQPSEQGGYAASRRKALDHLLLVSRDLLVHPEQHRGEIQQAIAEAVAFVGGDRARLERDLADFVLAAGHLQRFLDDPAVTEIMVSGARVIVERGGALQEAEGFTSADEAFELAERMALRMGERFQLANPILDFAWQDGSRVNLIHPILTGGEVAMTIRKPDRSRPLDLASLISSGTLTPQAAALLVAAVGGDRRNLLIAGSQNAGKTTLMRAVLYAALRPTPLRRVVLIEDTPELRLDDHPNLLAMRAHKPSAGETGARAVTLADLTRAAKRQRPDLLVIGEVRGGEGVDLVDAAQSEGTGVAGTLHVAKLEDLAGRFYYFGTLAQIGISPQDMKTWVYSTFHLVCHIDKGQDGRRRVVRIVRLQAQTQTMTDLFRYNPGTDTLEEVAS